MLRRNCSTITRRMACPAPRLCGIARCGARMRKTLLQRASMTRKRDHNQPATPVVDNKVGSTAIRSRHGTCFLARETTTCCIPCPRSIAAMLSDADLTQQFNACPIRHFSSEASRSRHTEGHVPFDRVPAQGASVWWGRAALDRCRPNTNYWSRIRGISCPMNCVASGHLAGPRPTPSFIAAPFNGGYQCAPPPSAFFGSVPLPLWPGDLSFLIQLMGRLRCFALLRRPRPLRRVVVR